nr:hypothetical protein [Tanacetum cinerariifolium]
MNKGVADDLKKRKPDDTDKDEVPSIGSKQGLKRQRTRKGTETSKKTSTTKDSSKGKSPATSLKSSKSSKSAKDQVVKPIFLLDSNNAKHDDTDYDDMPMDQEEDLGNTDEQPNDEAIPKNDLYKKSLSDTFLDPEKNKGKSVDGGPEQIPIYNLLKGTCKRYVELDYTMKECFCALSEQLDSYNHKGHRCPYDLTKPLPVKMSSQGRQIVPVDFFFNNDLEYLKGGSNDKKYTSSMTKSKDARYELKGIEDMVPNLWSPERVEDLKLGVECDQKKLNLTKPRTRDVDMSRRPVYTTLSNPQDPSIALRRRFGSSSGRFYSCRQRQRDGSFPICSSLRDNVLRTNGVHSRSNYFGICSFKFKNFGVFPMPSGEQAKVGLVCRRGNSSGVDGILGSGDDSGDNEDGGSDGGMGAEAYSAMSALVDAAIGGWGLHFTS